MPTERPESPERRFRFGFDGPVKRRREEGAGLGVDDILDSLSRRAKLGDQFDETARTAFENEAVSGTPLELPDSIIQSARKRAFGKFAFAFLMMAGVVAVWLYGALNAVLDSATIGRLMGSPILSSAFTDPVKLAILAVGCFVPVILAKRRRSAKERLLSG